MTPCPHCGQSIHPRVRQCPHCQELIDRGTTTAKKSAKKELNIDEAFSLISEVSKYTADCGDDPEKAKAWLDKVQALITKCGGLDKAKSAIDKVADFKK